jgi:O-antigen/teichoic acid export membrane protein
MWFTKRAATIKLNLASNFVGRACVGIISMVSVPIYIHLLGIEAYGLVGVGVTLTALAQVLDLGLSTTISREMARLSSALSDLSGGNRETVDREAVDQEARDLVRTLESIYWLIGLLAALGIMALAPLIAHRWVHAQGMSSRTVQLAIMLLGGIFAFQWPDSLYAGGLMGLQRQVAINAIRVTTAITLTTGSLLILKFVSHSILAFFTWQIIIYAAQTLTLMVLVWRSLPASPRQANFDRGLLAKNVRFTAGVSGVMLTSIVLMQLDNVLLMKQLPLKLFGYYALATALASNLLFPVPPIVSAVFPRMAQLATGGKTIELAALYHKSCQLLSLIIIPTGVIVAAFSRQLLSVYLRDAETVQHVTVLLSLLVIGSAFNSLVTLPFFLQLAYGYTRLSLYKNIVAVLLFVPALSWMLIHYRAVGAAWMWVLINAGYLVFEIPLMHRRLLRGEMRQWYLVDIGLPLIITVGIVGVAHWLLRDATLPISLAGIALTALFAFGTTGLTLQILQRSPRRVRFGYTD